MVITCRVVCVCFNQFKMTQLIYNPPLFLHLLSSLVPYAAIHKRPIVIVITLLLHFKKVIQTESLTKVEWLLTQQAAARVSVCAGKVKQQQCKPPRGKLSI